jgi:hypothetical protein
MAPIGDRFRQLIWAHPGQARMAVAGVVLAGVAGGAFVGLRPGDENEGRLRHRQYSGAIGADGASEGDRLDASSGSSAPGQARSAPDGARGAEGAAGTTATGAPTTAGGGGGASDPAAGGNGSSSTSTGATGGKTPRPGPGTTGATGPDGGAASPATARANGPRWDLLPKGPLGPRNGHTATWTGREMVIWGGISDFDAEPSTDGAAYDPAGGTWRKVPGAPITARYEARSYWTGQEMVIFGGASAEGDTLADGAAWNPATNTWRAIPASPLGPRDGAVEVWAGDRLVIWSGNTVAPPEASEDFLPEVKGDGAAYVPATNRWVAIGPAPIPPRSAAQAAWTGSRLIISGGEGAEDARSDGAALDPITGAWSPIAARPEADSCSGGMACTGVWTGTVVLFPASAQAYDPAADRWSVIAAAPGRAAPAPGEPAVWTGRQLLAWGVPGVDDDPSADDAADTGDGPVPAVGASYDPVSDRWETIPTGPLASRVFHTAVWTGDAMLIWGGTDNDEKILADGAAYRPE